MMSRHFGLRSELSGAIAKRLPHAQISFTHNGRINFYLKEKLALHLSRFIRNLDPKKIDLTLAVLSFDDTATATQLTLNHPNCQNPLTYPL